MYVKRLKLYGVKGFRLDLPLDGAGELPEAARHRLLLQGGNGSGKTTVLETISGLWEWFGKMIDSPTSSYTFPANSRWTAELNALELGDFPLPGKSFWIAVGTPNGVEDLRKAFPDTPLAFLRRSGRDSYIELPPGDWKSNKARSQEGVAPLPNVVHFPPEGRSILKPPAGGVKRIDLFEPNWLATFDASYDLDSLLFTVRVKQPERYDQAIELFNRLLRPSGKRVAESQERDGRLEIEQIELPRPPAHSWTALSSGERQLLLLTVYTVCLLREDSILLIDEPDLHIHIGAVKQLLDTLYSVVQERHGQMIATGHSQQLWDWFDLKVERISLGSWRRTRP